ncbi:helix-turn-helix domain-containing protein [Burkholderia pyrrocinia]|uniref:AraC-like ligand-binding domain-containing protein n=1 Tax=Burkholderia pyrrocinia TaxID=60550 RepID=UPI002AB1BC89|nr:helix-turn-helix domain-containing protein [Burkholderia pyrrocinia]
MFPLLLIGWIDEVFVMSAAQYSTTLVPVHQRFEYWKEVVCRHCIPAASQPLTDSDFDGTLEVHSVGMLDICSLTAPLHDWQRTPSHLRTGPDDDLWLGFSYDGHGRLEQGGRQAILGPDRLFLYDASQTFRFSLGGSNRLVRIPRYLLNTRLPGVEHLTATVLDEQRPGVVPLREMLRQAAALPEGLSEAGISGRFSQALLDLLVLSVELQDLDKIQVEHDLYDKVMSYVHRHLTDPELSLERVAEVHHVSTRTVTRAFARRQETLMSVVRRVRLEACREAIKRGSVRSVSQAAMDFGFSDFSHFSHAFRKAFGISPRTLLRRD